jgi:hypothetical protein
MNRRARACLAGALLASPLLAGCASTYMPRPSPRVQMVTENGSLVLVKDGRSHPFNMFGGNLEEVVRGNPQAEAEAQAFYNDGLPAPYAPWPAPTAYPGYPGYGAMPLPPTAIPLPPPPR